MNSITKIGIGSAINRVDGREKVTGAAKYAAEYAPAAWCTAMSFPPP